VLYGTLDIQPNVQPIRAVECMDSCYISISFVWYWWRHSAFLCGIAHFLYS